MKPPPFAYCRPSSVEEAVEALAQGNGDAIVLAGGQSLVPALNFRIGAPDVLVDINGLETLGGIELRADALWVGALTRHTELLRSPLVASRLPALALAARHIGHSPIRNRGTSGGSIAHADPAAEIAAVAAVVDAEIELTCREGRRTVAFPDFVIGPFATTRRNDELLTGIRFPIHPDLSWGFGEITRRSGDFALAGAVAGLAVLDGRVSNVRVSLFAVEPIPRRLRELESALVGAPATEIAQRVRSVELGLDLLAADTADAGYRRHLAHVALVSALEAAHQRCAGGP